MKTQVEKTLPHKNCPAVNNSTKQQSHIGTYTFQLAGESPGKDSRAEAQHLANNSAHVQQLSAYQSMANNSAQAKQMRAYQAMADNHQAIIMQKAEKSGEIAGKSHSLVQKKENKTGLPDKLKTGVERLSGFAMDDVNVHYNSAKPAQLLAHAYAQGTDIHVATGQEKHLPHEAWHVVQQKQGRVKPTLQMKGKINVNDDKSLEREADLMGMKALATNHSAFFTPTNKSAAGNTHQAKTGVVQCALADLAAKELAEIKKAGSKPGKETLAGIRQEIMERLKEDFTAEYAEFIKAEGGQRTHPVEEVEVKTALREYVKALTSTFQSVDDWDDVAILHKRKSEQKGPASRMDDETEKYSTIGHHTFNEWGLGTHHEMEASGQIYGPAEPGLDPSLKEGGRHSWGANAAWLMGHMHAGHRFIQVVPHTEDNLMRGSIPKSEKKQETGALAFEALGIMGAGYKKGRQEEVNKLWTEFVPTEKTLKTKLSALARPNLIKPAENKDVKQGDEINVIKQKLAAYGLTAADIPVEHVIKLDKESKAPLHAYETAVPKPSERKFGNFERRKKKDTVASEINNNNNSSSSSTAAAAVVNK